MDKSDGQAEDESPATIRYVTRDGYFAESIAPDWSWVERARERLAAMTDEEKREAAARYIAARYGTPDWPDRGAAENAL